TFLSGVKRIFGETTKTKTVCKINLLFPRISEKKNLSLIVQQSIIIAILKMLFSLSFYEAY
ncbi:MAG: hypothetical protein QXW78_05365, partial [Candidatus Thermoplasmatota archaeon]